MEEKKLGFRNIGLLWSHNKKRPKPFKSFFFERERERNSGSDKTYKSAAKGAFFSK